MVTLCEIQAAQTRLRGVTIRTPLIPFPLCDEDPRRLFLKAENQQPIGAFKLRGAYNKIASLSPQDRKRGVITYSSGNHAQGVAYAARLRGVTQSIEIDDARTLAILKANLTLTDQRLDEYLTTELPFDAKAALQCGLVRSIQEFTPPLGETLFNI